ncbi:MAG: universal stress protein [Thermoplasmata archaeon]
MYRHLLVPVKTPAEVEPMIRFAAKLLDADGEIRMLHIIPTTTMPQVTREWRASVNLVVPAHEVAAVLDVRVEPEVRASVDVPGEILESAEAHGIDGIVVGLGGDRRSRNPFVGHTVSGLLHHARTDVLILNRLALANPKVGRILVPSLRGPTSPRTMQLADQLALRMGGIPVVPLGPVSSAENGRRPPDPPEPRRPFAAGALLPRRRHLAQLLLRSAAQARYGFLVVGEETSDRSGPPVLTRPFLEELFREAPCPVLALRR